MTDQELIQALRCCAEGECKGCAVYADKQSCQENILAQAADRLEGRIKAYGEGRIVVLPCKVGDIVWANLDGMRHTRKCVIISIHAPLAGCDIFPMETGGAK